MNYSRIKAGIKSVKVKSLLLPLIFILLAGCKGSGTEEKSKLIEGKRVSSDHGMVVSAHPLGSEAGAKILQKGGNAVDAAIATEFALSVCYPEAGNIGGGGFMVIRTSDGKSEVIDYRERAPLKAARDMFLDKNGEVSQGLSLDTHLASGVPGTVDGMILAHKKYGSLPFSELVQPAVDLAEKGFPVTAKQAELLNSLRTKFIERNASKTAFVKNTPWKEGDTLVQKDLANTLKRIRDNGRDGFYSGRTASLIVREMKRGNGIITEQDLNNYKADERKTISRFYKGYRIITVPPPSGGGIILLQLLEMTEPYAIEKTRFHSPKSIHLIVEAERRAFADRAEYSGDPDFMKVPAEKLINRTYLLNRMITFDTAKASVSANVKAGIPDNYPEETTHYSVADQFGNAVSTTTTLNGSFGTCIVVDSAGFILNNEMDDFSLKPGVPNMYGLVGGDANSIQPGKKILSSMTPTIVEKNGKLFMVVGSPGGSTIPTTVFQVITNVIDYKMQIGDAVDAGRFHHQWLPDIVNYEHGAIDSLTMNRLKIMGYDLKERPAIGSVNAIIINSDGKKAGGADRRGDNTACGY